MVHPAHWTTRVVDSAARKLGGVAGPALTQHQWLDTAAWAAV